MHSPKFSIIFKIIIANLKLFGIWWLSLHVVAGISASATHCLHSTLSDREREQGNIQTIPCPHKNNFYGQINWCFLFSRLMVVMAWLTTLLFSSPQAVIFRVMKHPMVDFYQCTTWGFFEGLAHNVTQGNTTTMLLPGGLTPIQAADLYHTLFNCEVVH